jgi:hypothetical protein
LLQLITFAPFFFKFLSCGRLACQPEPVKPKPIN